MMPLSISEVKFADVIKYGTQRTMVNHNQPSSLYFGHLIKDYCNYLVDKSFLL